MSKLDIFHVIPTLFPYGAYSSLSELHYAIDKYYGDVGQHILSLKDENHKGMFELPHKIVPLSGLKAKIQSKSTNPVVFFHKLSATDCKPVSAVLYNDIPFVIVNHTQTNKPRGFARNNGIVAVSDHMYQTLSKGFKGFNFHRIRNGVNGERYENIEPYYPDEVEGYFVTGRMNNFNGCKHPNDWIPWVKATWIGSPHWHDYLGDGQYFQRASQQANKRGRSAMRPNVCNMPGRINGFKDKVAYLKRWQVFLYEIRGTEGTSMALLEALACGIPAIINNKPGNHEIVTKKVNGYVYNSREQLLAKIKYLVENPAYLEDLSASTKANFDAKLDARYMAKEYVDLAKKVINEF